MSVLRASSLLIGEQWARTALTAVLSVWIAARLGPAEFGLLNLGSALAAMGFVLMGLGLDLPLLLRLARGRPAARVLPVVLALRGAAALLALVLAALSALALRSGDGAAQTVLLLVALAVPAYVPCALELPLRAAQRPGGLVLARGLASLLAALAKLTALWLDASLLTFALLVVLEAALASLFVAVAWWRLCATGLVLRRRSLALLRPLLGAGLPMLATSFTAALHQKADLLTLGLLGGIAAVALGLDAVALGLGAVALGHYAVAQKLGELMLLAPTVCADSVLAQPGGPGAAGAAGAAGTSGTSGTAGIAGESGTASTASEQAAFDLSCAAGWVGALLVAAATPWAVPALFGSAYAPAVPLVHWLAAAAVLMALEPPRRRWLMRQGLSSLGWRLGLIGAGLTAVFAVLFTALLTAPFIAPLTAPLTAPFTAAFTAPFADLFGSAAGAHGVAAAAVLSWAAVTAIAPWLHPRARPLAALQWHALWPWGRLIRLRRLGGLRQPDRAGGVRQGAAAPSGGGQP